MLITKIIKLKGEQFKLYFNNGQEIILGIDLIIKYALKEEQSITTALLLKLEQENQECILYNKCLTYLKVRLRSEKEIRNYLKRTIKQEVLITKIVKRLKTENYINDYNFAVAYLQDRWHFSNAGLNKIKQELLKHDIKQELITSLLVLITPEMIKAKTIKLVTKQLKINSKYSGYVLKQKILNSMYQRGFDIGVVISYLATIDLRNTKYLKQEYQKLYHYYQSKYKGAELEFKIRQKLYQKGYKESDLLDLKQ